MYFDKIILGAGFYGLYAAELCASRGERVLVLEYDQEPFKRATFINQARIHMGYHYPRSYSTATRSGGYFERFVEDFRFCINDTFEKIYAISSSFSWTNAAQFQKFCSVAGIPCEEVSPSKYFKQGVCEGAFLTQEYAYDAQVLKERYLNRILELENLTVHYDVRISKIETKGPEFSVALEDGSVYRTRFLLNATYASVNQVLNLLGLELFKIKYELCEIILCKPCEALRELGITVMDGPFFSVMPFGNTGLHSLTSVTFTPHLTSHQPLPTFCCQQGISDCSPDQLGNCNSCSQRPESARVYMTKLANKYLREELDFIYDSSLFSVKPILKVSEIDDSRPTLVKVLSDSPKLVSVLSGKINTVYDLEEVLLNE